MGRSNVLTGPDADWTKVWTSVVQKLTLATTSLASSKDTSTLTKSGAEMIGEWSGAEWRVNAEMRYRFME